MAIPLRRASRVGPATAPHGTAPVSLSTTPTGQMGAVPPPGAPHEVSQPLRPELIQDQLTKARQHERELAPLTYGKPPSPAGQRPPVPGEVPAADHTVAAAPLPHGVIAMPGDPVAVVPIEAGVTMEDAAVPAADIPPLPPPLPDQTQFPAASNSDTPSRGIPAAILDPGKQITGGFAGMEAQYFPLDGQELRVLVESLLDAIYTRIQNDLRFSIAVTYPRVSARVVVEISGYEREDQNFIIPKIAKPHDKTPLEVARAVADEVCFVVIAEAQETLPDGASGKPPDQIRDDLGLVKPRKQRVEMGVGFQLADVVMGPGDRGTF